MKKAGGVTYKAAALLLKTAIMERPPTAHLPARFEIGNMAMFIADSNASTSDDDVETATPQQTRIYKTLASPPGSEQEATRKIGNESTSKPSIPPAIGQSTQTAPTQKASVSTLTSDLNRYMQGYTPHQHRINQTYRNKRDTQANCPTPEPHLGWNNPRRRRAYNPYTTCHACGRTGHLAVQCDTLAMAILIRKYMTQSGNAEEMKQASENWFKRNAEALKCPDNEEPSKVHPLQVLHTYMDRYLKDIDELDEQMDWEFFRNEDSDSCDAQE